MSDRGAGKWLPYDLDGTVHECKKETTSTGTKKVETKDMIHNTVVDQKTLTLEVVDARLRRVEKRLFNEQPSQG